MSKTILCIDDQRETLDTLATDLAGDGHHWLHTPRLEEGLQILRDERPDLLLLEIRLDDGDGLDWLAQVREDPEVDPALPVLVVTTASRTPRLYGRAVQLRAEDYLSKPVPGSQLVESVEQALSKERALVLTDPISEAPSGEEVATGSLRTLPIPELLDRLHLRGASGVLLLDCGGERTGIQLRNGSPIAVSVGQDETDNAVGGAERAEEQMLRLFERFQGRFRFVARRALRSARSLEVTSSVQSLIVRGTLGRSPAESVRAALGRFGELYPAPGVDLDDRFADVRASPAQRDFIASLSGDKPVAEYLSLSEFEQRTLYAFSILGVIKLLPSPMLVLADALPQDDAVVEEVQEADEAEPGLEDVEAAGAEPESEAARALEAESWFRKGTALMKRKDYAKAVEAFGMSSHLDPSQGEYVAHLGYSLYLSQPDKELVRKEALEHIARGIKLSPDREQSYVFLGRIFKVTGDVEVAKQMFRRALSVRPGCREAEQELRIIEMRKEKESAGLLTKLWSK